jgi:Tfp pilus assembly protein PilF
MKRALITVTVPVALLLVCAALMPLQAAAQEENQGNAGKAAETPAATPAVPATPAANNPATPPTTTAPPAEKPIQEIVDAWDSFRQRNVDDALKQLKKAVKKNADLPPPQVILAEFFVRANSGQGVQSCLEQAVIDAPNDPEAYYLMGAFALRDRRVTEAQLLYEKADSLVSKLASAKRKKILQPQILGGLAMTSGARGDWADAQKKLEAWLKLEPESTAALQQLGQCLLQQKNEQGALEQLVKASKSDPKLLSPEAFLAQFYARSTEANSQDNAKKWMIAALNARPKDLRTRLLAAQWAWETGQLPEAKKQADAAMKIDPQSIEAQFFRGLIALFQKDYTAAEEYFQNAHLLSPKEFRVSNNLALALIEQKGEDKKQRALEYAEANARQYPKSAEALSTYGWVLYKLGRLDDSERMLRGAISGGSFSADTAYYLARLLAKRGRDKDARQFLESAVQSAAPFQNREDAKAMLEELKK